MIGVTGTTFMPAAPRVVFGANVGSVPRSKHDMTRTGTEMIRDVQATIVNRVNAERNPFAEILYTFTEDGRERFALTRVWHPLTDSPHARAHEVQAFLKRRGAV